MKTAMRFRWGLACILGLALPVGAQQSDAELLSEAARRGDAPMVRALLEKGVDANTKFRYDVTALFYACDRGHLEVVKVLLDHGAEVNLRDSFYQSTPLVWAASPAAVEDPTEAHIEIVKLLLAKGAQGGEQVLLSAARGGNLALVRAALGQRDLKPHTLTGALSTAMTGKHEAIVEALRAAGAQPPFQVDQSALAVYVGKYRSDEGEIGISLSDGKLMASRGGRPIPLFAMDNLTFYPEWFAGLSTRFRVEGGKALGFLLNEDGKETFYVRVDEETKP